MGCDIHLYAEKKVDGIWVYIDKLNVGRNYELFGFLAGVRNAETQHFRPKGVPDDISKEVREELEYWGSDGHTHSYLTLEELYTVDWEDEKATVPLSGIMDNDQWDKFEASIKSGKPNYELMYPYWAAGGDPETSSYHEWEYPMKLEYETFYENVVKRLPVYCIYCKPNELRIVFWFDN